MSKRQPGLLRRSQAPRFTLTVHSGPIESDNNLHSRWLQQWAALASALSTYESPPHSPMKCQKCDKPATFHITDLVDGETNELHLCEQCAQSFLAPQS